MSPRALGAVALVLLALIVLSRTDRPAPPATVAPPPSPVLTEPAAPTGPATGRQPRLAPLPNALEREVASTREIDLLAILAVRRRIAREGSLVYLDSLLAQTDSTVVRWADRNGQPLRVALVPDTTLEGWNPAFLAAARDGLEAWRNNAAGLRFALVPDTSAAEIQVQFVRSVSDSSEFGVTQLDWQASGTASRASIRLALRPQEDGPIVSPAVLRRVAAHEFGHAIGLPHSASRNDIMFPSSPVAEPSRRDQATLQLLYAVPPGSLKTP